jgi:hypothetical protein
LPFWASKAMSYVWRPLRVALYRRAGRVLRLAH